MYSSLASLTILLLPAVLAVPHGHGQQQYEHYAPQSSSVSGAPYGIQNATAKVATIGTQAHHNTDAVTHTLQSTLYLAGSSAASAPAQAATAAQIGNEKLACALTTVTAPPVTVTITAASGNGGGAGSAGSVTASTASVAPVKSSPANAPTQASVPTQAASSAGAAGSGNTVSAAPVGLLSPSAAPVASPSTQAEQRPASSAPAVAASSATPAPSSSSAPATGGTSGSKRGLLIPAGGTDQKGLVSLINASPKISWAANWWSGPPPGLDASKDFVPQMYGLDSDTSGEWTKNAQKAEAAGTKYFLSFGEPETENPKLYQTAQGAAQFWIKEMQPYTDKVTIGAPGVLQNTKDFTWLSEFLDACDGLGCKIGFVAVHWFYTAKKENVQGFKDVVNNATAIAKGKPVWVDNFQATGSNADQQAFLGEVVPWLEANDKVQRYAYVTPDANTGTGLLNGDGGVSSLGQYYANL